MHQHTWTGVCTKKLTWKLTAASVAVAAVTSCTHGSPQLLGSFASASGVTVNTAGNRRKRLMSVIALTGSGPASSPAVASRHCLDQMPPCRAQTAQHLIQVCTLQGGEGRGATWQGLISLPSGRPFDKLGVSYAGYEQLQWDHCKGSRQGCASSNENAALSK